MATMYQMMVDKPKTPLVVPTLMELFRQEEEPQEEPPRKAPLPSISFPSGLLMPEESNLSFLVDAAVILGISSPRATLIPVAALLSSPLIPIMIPEAAGPSMVGQMPMPEMAPSGKPLLVSISPLVYFSSLSTTLAKATGLLASSFPTLLLMLAIIMVSQLVDGLLKGAIVAVGKGKLVMQVPLGAGELS